MAESRRRSSTAPVKGDSTPAPPPTRRTLPQPGTLGRAVLLIHLVLSPVLFSRSTVEAFEFNKTSLLSAVAVILLALGAAGLIRRCIRAGAPTWAGLGTL